MSLIKSIDKTKVMNAPPPAGILIYCFVRNIAINRKHQSPKAREIGVRSQSASKLMRQAGAATAIYFLLNEALQSLHRPSLRSSCLLTRFGCSAEATQPVTHLAVASFAFTPLLFVCGNTSLRYTPLRYAKKER